MKNKTSQLRSIEILRKQLADLEGVLASDAPNLTDLASIISLDDLNAQKKDLLEELKASEWLASQSDMEIALDGSSVVDHSVPACLLSIFMEQIQKLRYVSAEMASGATSFRGQFTNRVFTENELLVKSFTPSSFALQVKYAKESLPQNELNHSSERSGENLFLSLLSGETAVDDVDFTSMNSTIRDYYNEFLDFVIKNEIIINTRTRNHPFPVQMTPDNARNLKLLINAKRLTPAQVKEEITIEGVLMMGDLMTLSFEIDTDLTSYTGQISDSGLEDIKILPVGTKVLAKLLVIPPSQDSEKTIYSLVSIVQSSS
jgi:hypothetical protein